jgi:hypothetical protein
MATTSTLDGQSASPNEYFWNLLSLPKLVMYVLHNLQQPTPIPYRLMIGHIREQFAREVTSEQLSVTIAHARNAWGRADNVFLAPALRPDGRAARGWLTRSDWPLYDRVIPFGEDGRAAERGTAAILHLARPSFSGTSSSIIAQALPLLRQRTLREQTFGKDT